EKSAKPCPKRNVDCHVELENKPAEDGDSCEPAENRPEKRQSGEVAETKIPKPGMARLASGKPNCRHERYKRDPAEPDQIKRRETAGVQKPATDRCQPRPDAQHFR